MTVLRTFWQEDRGQALIEYTLVMALVALVSAALFVAAGASTRGIWANPQQPAHEGQDSGKPAHN